MSAKVHVHLHVSDLAKSREFYRAFFGTAPVKDLADYVKFLPGWAPVNLALSEGRPAAAGAAVDHLGVQVDSPAVVSEHLARVKGAGLAVREEMGVDCCHANQDKFWVQDPDGVEWEVYHLNYDLAGGLQDQVKAKYGAAALRVVAGSTASCCGGGSAAVASSPVTANLYGADETATLPAEAVQASLGCGNPVALAELRPGEVVLDLGSGGGIDVLLSARRVGPTGKAYGLDMTDEMLALARDNQAKAGVTNVEFLRGRSRRFRCRTRRWTSSSPTASSTCRRNRPACSPRRSGSCGPAGGWPFPTSWSGARCRSRSGRASRRGSAASPAPWKSASTRRSWTRSGSRGSSSSRRASIAPPTPVPSWRGWTACARRWSGADSRSTRS